MFVYKDCQISRFIKIDHTGADLHCGPLTFRSFVYEQDMRLCLVNKVEENIVSNKAFTDSEHFSPLLDKC